MYSGSSSNRCVGPKFLKPEPQSARLNCPLLVLFLWESTYLSIWSRLVSPLDLKNFIYSITSLSSRSLMRF